MAAIAPALKNVYPFREGSHGPPSRRPPHPVFREFHSAIKRAWRQWHTTLLPLEVPYHAWVTSDPETVRSARASALSVLRAGKDLGPVDEPRITAEGIDVTYVCAMPKALAANWTALAILPKDIGDFARIESIPIAAVPIPPSPHKGRIPLHLLMRLTVRALEYRVNWKGEAPVSGAIPIDSSLSSMESHEGGSIGMELGIGALRCRLSRQLARRRYAAVNGEWGLAWAAVPDHAPETASVIAAVEEIIRRHPRGASLQRVFKALASGAGAPVVNLSPRISAR